MVVIIIVHTHELACASMTLQIDRTTSIDHDRLTRIMTAMCSTCDILNIPPQVGGGNTMETFNLNLESSMKSDKQNSMKSWLVVGSRLFDRLQL